MRSRLLPVFVVVVLDLLGFTMLFPVLPYLAQSFLDSGMGTTLLMAIYAGMQLFCIPIWGMLSDRIGRRPVMIMTMIGSIVSYLCLALASNYGWLLASRIIAGIFTANIAISQSMFADLTLPAERTRGMAMFGVAMGVSFVLGPALGGMFSGLGYHAVGFASAACALVNLVLCWRWLPETRWVHQSSVAGERISGFWHEARPRAMWKFLHGYGVAGLVLLFLVFIFAASFMESTFGLVMKNVHLVSAQEVGILMAGLGGVMIVVQGVLVVPLTRYLEERGVIVLGCLSSAVGFLGFGLAVDFWTSVVPSVIMMGFGQGILYTAIVSATSRRMPSDAQGRTLGVNTAISSVGRAAGPIWAGFAYDHISQSAPFVSAAVVLLGMGWFVKTGIVYVGPTHKVER